MSLSNLWHASSFAASSDSDDVPGAGGAKPYTLAFHGTVSLGGMTTVALDRDNAIIYVAVLKPSVNIGSATLAARDAGGGSIVPWSGGGAGTIGPTAYYARSTGVYQMQTSFEKPDPPFDFYFPDEVVEMGCGAVLAAHPDSPSSGTAELLIAYRDRRYVAPPTPPGGATGGSGNCPPRPPWPYPAPSISTVVKPRGVIRGARARR